MISRTAVYDRNAGNSLAPRDVEAAAFLFVNGLLEAATTTAERVTALGRNHRLWSLLISDIGLTGNALPPILKQDLVSIGTWSMAYSIMAMSRDLPVQPLMAVNNDMVEALRPALPATFAPATPVPAARTSLAVAV